LIVALFGGGARFPAARRLLLALAAGSFAETLELLAATNSE